MTNVHPLKGKKVLFVLCGFDLGGAERQALYFARHLKGLGCVVRVWGHHHRYSGPERVIEHCDEVGIPWAEYKFRWPCGKVALVRDAFRLLKGLYYERPDVILSYTTWPNIGCGLVWRWSPAKAFVWGQRDLAPLKSNWIERLAYRGASTVICNAAHEVEYLNRSIGKTSAPMHVVHNGIKLAPPQRTRSQWRSELGISGDAPVATMLANLRTDKDHLTLLQSWRKILDAVPSTGVRARLVLAGAHQESSKDVRALVSELALGDSVSLPGQISDVAGFLSACDIGILCTMAEGLPNAILEYMTCGLPVIASDIPGNREALGNDVGAQLYHSNDVDDLATKLMVLIHSPELRQTLGTANQRRAQAEFSIEAMCNRMTAVVNDALVRMLQVNPGFKE